MLKKEEMKMMNAEHNKRMETLKKSSIVKLKKEICDKIKKVKKYDWVLEECIYETHLSRNRQIPYNYLFLGELIAVEEHELLKGVLVIKSPEYLQGCIVGIDHVDFIYPQNKKG